MSQSSVDVSDCYLARHDELHAMVAAMCPHELFEVPLARLADVTGERPDDDADDFDRERFEAQR